MLRKGQFTEQHFDDQFNFLSQEFDKLTNKVCGCWMCIIPTVRNPSVNPRSRFFQDVVKKMVIVKPVKDLKSRLAPGSKASAEEIRLITSFTDLLEKALHLNPEKRLTPKEALSHPFITGKFTAQEDGFVVVLLYHTVNFQTLVKLVDYTENSIWDL